MMTLNTARIAPALALMAMVYTQGGSGLHAQQNRPLTAQPDGVEVQSATSYWTAERLAGAQPLPLPLPALRPDTVPEPQITGGAQGRSGRAPTVTARPDTGNQLYDPASVRIEAAAGDEGSIEPQDEGTLRAPYTSSRVVPLSNDLVFPYRAAGKLFFTIPGQGNFVCSAAVIQQRVVATAGHCVHSGSGGAAGFYTNFLFVPALRDGNAPLQSWNWAYAAVTGTWASGNGAVPNAADYAMLEVEDRLFSGVSRRIGEITGWFGWQTLSLSRNHTTKLGYPCNIDSCQKMHVELSGNFRNTSPNNVEYGSQSGGGSSGGPWVQNFGAPGTGQTGGLNPGTNRIVGVTSYGYTSTDPKVQGASILDSRWTQIWNMVCAHRAGNCS